MDYTSLPPSRRRGIVYANNLHRRRRRRIRAFSPIRTLRTSPVNFPLSRFISPPPPPPLPFYNQPIRTLVRYTPPPPRIVQHFDEYTILTQLQDVKIGLLTKNLLKNSTVKLNENETEFCVICQDNIEIDDIIRNIKCSHNFHIDCIDNWFTENKKCPTCKYELS
jgi:hypothetical protein